MNEIEENPLEVIKADIKEIKTRIGHIEESVKKTEGISKYYFLFSVGLACMVAGMGLSVTGNETWGVIIFLLVLMLAFTSFSVLPKKPAKKSK